MEELQGLRQQVIIATTGRLGVRVGGTRECIVDTLKETQEWPITEENFGKVLFGAAQKIKADVIAQIEQLLTQWDERQRIANENAALQARIDAQKAEEARLEAARMAEFQRIADAQAQLERDQEALRAEREKPALADIPLQPGEPMVGAPDVVLPDPGKEEAEHGISLVDEPAAESGPVAQATEEPTDPLLMTIRLTELLPMQTVCKFAKEWAVFQHRDSKLAQKKDRQLAQRAREAEANLLAVVEQLP